MSGEILKHGHRPHSMDHVGAVKCPTCGKPGKGFYISPEGIVRVRHMAKKEGVFTQTPASPPQSKRTIWCVVKRPSHE